MAAPYSSDRAHWARQQEMYNQHNQHDMGIAQAFNGLPGAMGQGYLNGQEQERAAHMAKVANLKRQADALFLLCSLV